MYSIKRSVFYFNFLVQFVISTFDVHYPIILSSNSNGYFGYTVGLSNSPSMRNSEYGWIFIGSPNDTNPLLKCRLSSGNEHCTSLYQDPSFITQFGITLSTRPNDNNIVTCSHFKYRKESTLEADMDGSCLVVQEDNNFFEIGSGKLPSKTQDYNANWAPQIGISSFIRNEKVIVGVPGIDYLRGSVLIYDNLFARSPSHSFIRIISNEGHYAQLGSLFGYGVTAGKYFGNGILYYAVGTPKAHGLTGNVVVFRVDGNRNPVDSTEIREELPNIGSYFGSVVFSYSIWRNTKDELFISAPFHNTIASSSKENSGELHKGRVYIYTVLGNKFQLWHTLEPDNNDNGESYFARFGSAITGLGDINGDKINDFAVGAPGENNGRGAVYVYFGLSPSELHKELKYIKIKASFIDTRLNGFGSSLFGNIDFDGNATPDLAIGAFPSRQIAILRTRPLIELELKLLIISNNKVVQTISRNERHFYVEVCLKYKTRYPLISQKLKVYWILKIDDYQKDKTCTIEDARTPIKIPRKMDHIIEVQDEYSMEDTCKRIKVNIKLDDELTKFDDIIFDLYAQYIPRMYENLNSSSNLDKSMSPRNIIIDLNQSPRSGLYQISEERSRVQAKIEDFCPKCPNATEKFLTTRLIINPEDCKEDKCNPQFSIKTRWMHNNQEVSSKFRMEQLESSVGTSTGNDLMMEVLIKNSGESAINPVLSLRGNILGIQMSLFNLTRYNCSAKYLDDNNDGLLECDLGKFLRNGQMIQLLFKSDFSNYFASDLTEVLITSISIKQRYDESDRSVHHESRIQLQNKPTFPKIVGINETRNINLKLITHSYKISLNGQRAVQNLLLVFLLPQFIRIKDEYVEYFRVKELEPDCSVIGEENETIFEIKKSLISIMYNNDSVIHIGCSSLRSKIGCIHIQCVKRNIRFIRDDDFIEISFTLDVLQELDNLFEIDGSKRDIAYESQGYVKVFGESSVNSSMTLLQERIPSSISSTLLIVSSLGGLFLLALLILAFYKDSDIMDSSLKLIMEERDTIRATRVKAENELAEKVKNVKIGEAKLREKAGEVFLLEQKLRTINENIYLTQNKIGDKEKKMNDLVVEYVELEGRVESFDDKIQDAKNKYLERIKIREEQIKKVQEIENSQLDNSYNLKMNQLREEVRELVAIKKGLDEKDPELIRIQNGQALEVLEAQKKGLHEAFDDKVENISRLNQELVNLEDSIQKTKLSIYIEERQIQARVLQMEKKLREIEDKERDHQEQSTHI